MKQKITQAIEEFINAYPRANNAQSTWGQPLVAFAEAKDPRFDDLKVLISPTHALPADFIQDAGTVIAFFIPFSQCRVRG